VSLFVTFEGPDGAGKSTQTSLVAELLQNAGYQVVMTREPGGTPLGERIRSVLLEPGECAIVPRAEALLMSAARAQHVSDVIKPALDKGAIVLCDRFTDSTLAYQGAGRGLPIPELEQLQQFAVGSLSPDLTILLDISAKSGIRRRFDSGVPLNRLDQDDLAFHDRVREWYVQAAGDDPGRWVVFDATRDPDELAQLIAETIVSRINSAGANRKGE
jgi:dTMP kinase